MFERSPPIHSARTNWFSNFGSVQPNECIFRTNRKYEKYAFSLEVYDHKIYIHWGDFGEIVECDIPHVMSQKIKKSHIFEIVGPSCLYLTILKTRDHWKNFLAAFLIHGGGDYREILAHNDQKRPQKSALLNFV